MGGGGYLGSYLCGHLLRQNHKVFVVDKLNYGNSGVSPYLREQGYWFLFMDASTGPLDLVFKEFEPMAVIDLVALVDPVADKFQDDAVKSNVMVTERLVGLCNQPRTRLVFTSTCSNYGRAAEVVTEESLLTPTSSYATTKIAAEAEITKHSRDYVILRMGTLYGIAPRLRLDTGWWTTEPSVDRVANGIPAPVDRIKALGNAVVPQIAEWIGQRIEEFDASAPEG